MMSIPFLLMAMLVGSAGVSVASLTSIPPTGFGMRGAPRLTLVATCSSVGHQAVWAAETGTEYLDIIQIGTMAGKFFYAYGRGNPNAPGSLYVEKQLGPSGTGPHRYSLSLANRIWSLGIDNRVVATVSDTFRTWKLRASQIMAEGTLPFGTARCSSPGYWNFGGYGPQPTRLFGHDWWSVP